MALGQRRADAVRNYIITQGYPAQNVAPAESRGKRELLADYPPVFLFSAFAMPSLRNHGLVVTFQNRRPDPNQGASPRSDHTRPLILLLAEKPP
jgi:hypothetical protein